MKPKRGLAIGTLVAVALSAHAGEVGQAPATATPASTPAPMTPAPATSETAGAITVETYRAPDIRTDARPKLSFPISAKRRATEGWVLLSSMIDATGKPYEVTVVDSNGVAELDDAAVKWFESSVFTPASIDGKPVDAGMHYRVRFVLRNLAPAARTSFVGKFRGAQRALEANDRASADKYISEMNATNHYEDAYLHVVRYLYAVQWSDEFDQLDALAHAVDMQHIGDYLPRDTRNDLVRRLLSLQLKLGDYASAMRTAPLLDEATRSDPAILKLLGDLNAFATDSRAFRTRGRIRPNMTSWFGELLKRSFSIDVESGAIAEIKLRCQRDYVFFRYEPGITYSLPPNAGTCDIELVGNPSTRFSIRQS